jgi:hypothetical protein
VQTAGNCLEGLLHGLYFSKPRRDTPFSSLQGRHSPAVMYHVTILNIQPVCPLERGGPPWPLLTVETEANGDLWSTSEKSPYFWLVRRARRAGTRDFYSVLL